MDFGREPGKARWDVALITCSEADFSPVEPMHTAWVPKGDSFSVCIVFLLFGNTSPSALIRQNHVSTCSVNRSAWEKPAEASPVGPLLKSTTAEVYGQNQ